MVLSLETTKIALNAHQQIIIGETVHRPLRCALTATRSEDNVTSISQCEADSTATSQNG